MGYYAKKLTKQYLLDGGITNITEDGHVYRGDYEVKLSVNGQGYLYFSIYALDDNKEKIKLDRDYRYQTKDGDIVYYGSYIWKCQSVGLHRAIWA